MVADDVAVGEGGVCKSDNIRFIINVLPGNIFVSQLHGQNDFGLRLFFERGNIPGIRT